MITQNNFNLNDYLHSLEHLTRARPTDISKWMNTPERQFELLTKSRNPEFILKNIDNLSMALFFLKSILLSWAYQPDTDPFEEPFLGFTVLEELKIPVAMELREIAENLQTDPFEWTWRKYLSLKELYTSLWSRIIRHVSPQKLSFKTILDHLTISHHGNDAFLAANVFHFMQIHDKDDEWEEKDLFLNILIILKNQPKSSSRIKTFITRCLESLESTRSASRLQDQGTEYFSSPRYHLLPHPRWKDKTIVVGMRFNSLEVFLDIAVTEPFIPNEILISEQGHVKSTDYFSKNEREILLESDQITWEELEQFMRNHGYMMSSSDLSPNKDVTLIEELLKWLTSRCLILLDSWMSNQPRQLILVLERSISTDFTPFRSPTTLNLRFLARMGHRVLGMVEELATSWHPIVQVEHVDTEPRWDACPLCNLPIDEAHLLQLQPEERTSLIASIVNGGDEDETVQVHVLARMSKDGNSFPKGQEPFNTDVHGVNALYLVGDLSGVMILLVKNPAQKNALQVGKSYLLKGVRVIETQNKRRMLALQEQASIIPLPHALPHVNTNNDLTSPKLSDQQ